MNAHLSAHLDFLDLVTGPESSLSIATDNERLTLQTRLCVIGEAVTKCSTQGGLPLHPEAHAFGGGGGNNDRGNGGGGNGGGDEELATQGGDEEIDVSTGSAGLASGVLAVAAVAAAWL